MGLVKPQSDAVPFKQRQKAPIFDPQWSDSLGAGQIATMSFARDPNAKSNYIAKELNLPPNRIDFFDNLPVYINDQGQQLSLVPEWSFNPSDILKRSAFFAGDLPVTIGSIGSTAIPAPVPPLTKSAIGTGIGETVRQGIASVAVGEDLSGMDKAKFQLMEQGFNLGGEMAGNFVSRLTGKYVPVNIFAKELSDKRLNEYNELLKKAQQVGVDFLSPAEGTRLKSFAAMEQVLQRSPMSAEVIEQVLELRNEQVSDAVLKYIDMISPTTGSLVESGQLAKNAANDAIQAKINALRAEAGPMYKQAFRMGGQIDITKTLTKIARMRRKTPDGSPLRSVLDNYYEQLTWRKLSDKTGTRYRRRNLELLHEVKLDIDRALKSIDSLGEGQKVRLFKIKKSLLNDIRKNGIGDNGKAAGELYDEARNIYEEGMPAITQLDSSLVNIVAETKETNLHKVADSIFNPAMSDPKTMLQVKQIIQSQNPEAWTALIGTYLQQQWMKAPEAVTGNILEGAKFRKAVFGNKAKRRMWEAALEPEQFKALSDLMDVLEVTGKVFSSQQSITAFAGVALKDIEKSGSALANVPRVLSPQLIGENISMWLKERGARTITKRLAEIITEPDAIENLRKFKLLGDKNTRQIIDLLKLLGVPYLRSEATPMFAPERRDDIPQMQPTTKQNDLKGWPEGAVNIPTPNLFGGNN
tara:strand:- start:936 stop:3023 length:2088 start_codon:yes stop_codon:yes gene_type:complete